MQIIQKNMQLTESASNFEMKVLNIYPNLEQQTILGFGGAFSEAAAYNYAQMDAETKEKLLEAYFGESGTRYNIGRIPMGSCDFALAPYSESLKEDLSDFHIEQDKKYIIPMVKDALKKANRDIFLFASPWSPPAFMKDSGELNHGGELKPEYYETYANYFVKFILAYQAEGIHLSAVSVQNEANAKQRWESCRYNATQEAEFATNYLRPALDKNGLQDVKIILWDHNKERLVERAQESFAVSGSEKAIWGIGYHWYSGEHFDALDLFRKYYPQKAILETEFCHEMIGSFDEESRNIDYANEYIQSLKHGSLGLCDWNLILDPTGGPYHWRRENSGCAAAFYYDAEKKQLIQDGIYRSIFTIVSQIEKGDVVVPTTCSKQNLPMVAVKKKDGRVALFVLNKENQAFTFAVRMGEKGGEITVEGNALCSFIFENK